MWQVVYVAPNASLGEMVKELLNQKGFLVMLRSAGVPHMGAAAPHEVLVPEVEAAEANDVLAGVLAAGLSRRKS